MTVWWLKLTSPPRISPFSNTSLLILRHPIPLILPQQLFNSLILTSDSLPSPSKFETRETRQVLYWSCYNLVPIPTYLDPSAWPRWALLPRLKSCSCCCASVLRRALQAETHQKNMRLFWCCLWCIYKIVFVHRFFNLLFNCNRTTVWLRLGDEGNWFKQDKNRLRWTLPKSSEG